VSVNNSETILSYLSVRLAVRVTSQMLRLFPLEIRLFRDLGKQN